MGDGAGGGRTVLVPHAAPPASIPLRVFVLVLKLLVDDAEGGEEVPQEEDEEGEATHEDLREPQRVGVSRRDMHGAPPIPGQPPAPPYLPLLALRVLEHAEEGDGIVELPELQEREDLEEFLLSKAQPSADVHPGAPSGHKIPHSPCLRPVCPSTQ